MGPIMYIGRETSFKGKRLFDILCRLKNFGVGRIVYRNTFHERYPEPSYYVVKKVFPNMSDPVGHIAYTDIYDKQLTKGTLVANAVFRGENKGERVVRAGFKNDWHLVPRQDEEAFLSREHEPLPVNTVPRQCEFPPLFEHFLLADMQKHKMDTSAKPMMPIIVKQGIDNRAIYESEIESLEEQLSS